MKGTAADNKKVFDNLVRNVVAEQLNGLVDDLAGNGGAAEIGASPISGLDGDNVQQLLAEMKAVLDERIEEAGVASFNGRSGIVAPEIGDYTAAMVGAAPAGFGLGGLAKLLTADDDLDTIWECGKYYWWVPVPKNSSVLAGGITNMPASCVMDVRNLSDGNTSGDLIYTLQTIRCVAAGDANQHYTMRRETKIHRITKEFVDATPWEYVDPLAVLGVEIRTTERWNGKPVYCKLVSFALGAGKKTHNLGVSNVANAFIDVSKSRVATADPSISSILPVHGWIEELRTNANGGCEIIVTTTVDLTGYTAYICVKYTKTTD